jgi:hypothetical protein
MVFGLKTTTAEMMILREMRAGSETVGGKSWNAAQVNLVDTDPWSWFLDATRLTSKLRLEETR